MINVIGDIIIDEYWYGDTTRVSPEAPVPIVNISTKDDKMGGAANVAKNIKKLGGTPILCSIIGQDNNGDNLLSLLKKSKIQTDYIHQSTQRLTTTKTSVNSNLLMWVKFRCQSLVSDLVDTLKIFL